MRHLKLTVGLILIVLLSAGSAQATKVFAGDESLCDDCAHAVTLQPIDIIWVFTDWIYHDIGDLRVQTQFIGPVKEEWKPLKEEIIKALNEQMSETYDFINLHAKDNFLDQCLLFLAIRIIELRSRITNFKSEEKYKIEK